MIENTLSPYGGTKEERTSVPCSISFPLVLREITNLIIEHETPKIILRYIVNKI